MEIEKIVSNVESKLGKTDFSSQTVRKAVELFAVPEGQEPDEAYFDKVSDFLKGMQGQYNHDFSTKFGEYKKNYRLDEQSIKDYSEEELSSLKAALGLAKQEEKHTEDDVSALKAELEELKTRLDNGDKSRRQSELLSSLRSLMKSSKADDEYVLDVTLRGAVLDDKKSLEELAQEWLPKYDAEYTKCRNGATSPRLSQGGGKGQSWLDQKFAQKAKKEGWGNS